MTRLDDLEVVFAGESVSVRFGERHAATHHLDRRLFFSVRVQAPGLELAWTIRPWRHSGYGEWEATVTTTMEAGAEKDDLTAQLHAFLTAEGFPVEYSEAEFS